ncbi:MAG: hypothetical protein HGB08_04525 [Candidatus Moranbacteria bacterium]|nr:hypothetical protein [Candidatus Moranbacteria bacterium]
MKRKLLLITTGIAILSAGYLFAMRQDKQDAISQSASDIPEPSSASIRAEKQSASASFDSPSGQSSSVSSSSVSSTIKLDVPFIVQAPFANWSDPIFQNACEEASIVMAMGWIHGEKTITPADAKTRIEDIVDFENKSFGYNADTDVSKMQKIFREYFRHEPAFAKEGITLSDMKYSLSQGNLVIVPAFGQALHNPNYTAPGPIAHMLVITGYDAAAKEFATNDPGTRNGAGYRYKERVLFDAIWEYPSGPDIPAIPVGDLKKAMISVSRQ